MRLALLLALFAVACHREPAAVADAGARDGCACHHRHADASAAPRPSAPAGASVLDLPSTWTSQSGDAFALESLRGHPTLVLMFYGTCRGACPVLIRDVLRIDRALSPEARARTRVLLVTFDPESDTPARLRELAAEHGLDLSRWTLVSGAAHDTRALAALLGVTYTRTGPGAFDHSNTITLLDEHGAVQHQTEGLTPPIDEFVRLLEVSP